MKVLPIEVIMVFFINKCNKNILKPETILHLYFSLVCTKYEVTIENDKVLMHPIKTGLGFGNYFGDS